MASFSLNKNEDNQPGFQTVFKPIYTEQTPRECYFCSPYNSAGKGHDILKILKFIGKAFGTVAPKSTAIIEMRLDYVILCSKQGLVGNDRLNMTNNTDTR